MSSVIAQYAVRSQAPPSGDFWQTELYYVLLCQCRGFVSVLYQEKKKIALQYYYYSFFLHAISNAVILPIQANAVKRVANPCQTPQWIVLSVAGSVGYIVFCLKTTGAPQEDV